MSKASRWSILMLGGALAVAPSLQARTCAGNADIIGSYGWYGARAAEFVPAPSDPPVTPIAGSNTPIGAFATAAKNPTAFALIGRIYTDGNGGIWASPNATSAIVQVGTYVANSDCTISATITDTFATPTDPFLPAVQASAKFEGVVVQGGNEVDLVQSTGVKGATLVWRKTRQYNGCTTEGFTGTFGFTASGRTTTSVTTEGSDTPTVTVTPFSLGGRFVPDGTGKFVTDPLALTSPLTTRQYVGAYSVNADCTGTGTLIDSAGKSRKITFVIVSNGTGANPPSGVFFSFTDSNVSGAGFAQQQ